MNSKQRRRDRRRHCFGIIIHHKTWDEYEAAWYWLSDRYGRNSRYCGWRDRDLRTQDLRFDSSLEHWSTRWEFDSEKTYLAFVLAWG
jgi:hypothetical protein